MSAGLVTERIRPGVSPDAVVVVPGIMGSRLENNRGAIWGIDDLSWYAHAWTHPRTALDSLALGADEQRGEYGRVRATGLLKVAAWAPFLQGIEPYGPLVRGIEDVVVHPDAVLEFAYDWRLPVTYLAGLLCSAANSHLARWRQHPEYLRFSRDRPHARPAQLVFVAHSMGGLLVRALPKSLDVRATVTIATPFDGSAKAAMILSTGSGAPLPLPKRKLQAACHTMPGLHDLLPTYRCLNVEDPGQDPIPLTPQHVTAFGGNGRLAAAAFKAHDEMADKDLPGQHQALIGTDQPTISTLSLTGARLDAHPYSFEPSDDGGIERDGNGLPVRVLRFGDGTVPHNSALFGRQRPVALAQQHGPIAKSEETVRMVQTVLREGPTAPRLGGGDLSIDLPDLAPIGTGVAVPIGGIEAPADATVTVLDQHGRDVDSPEIRYVGGEFVVELMFGAPGIYQVEVSGGGTSPISQRCLATDR